MIALWLLLIPLIGGAIAWIVGRTSDTAARWVALGAMFAELIAASWLWIASGGAAPGAVAGGSGTPASALGGSGLAHPIAAFQVPWIPQLGASLHLAVDGLSLPLVTLAAFLGIVAVSASFREITERVGAFHAALLWVIAGTVGVFLAADLLLLYVMWELMLVPMYFLIALWGHEDRRRAAFKFFLFTQFGGMLLLIAIVGLYLAHAAATGDATFEYSALLSTPLAAGVALWLMLGFFAAFAIKLPVIPFHTWLADAHTQAPTAGSVVLAGLLLKTGAYGFIRFAVPLFPEAAATLAPVAVWLGVAGVLYGALLAFAQTDLKRLIAYTSVSHMGFVLMGVFAGTRLALTGATLEILAHGISTGALFMLGGALAERLGTRDMNRMGGLWPKMPRMGVAVLLFAFAAAGLPGLGNFVAEFMVLAGVFEVMPAAAAVAAVGIAMSAVYSLWMFFRVFQGPPAESTARDADMPAPGADDLGPHVPGTSAPRIRDLGPREIAVVVALAVAIIWLGLYPQPVVRSFVSATSPIAQHAQVVHR